MGRTEKTKGLVHISAFFQVRSCHLYLRSEVTEAQKHQLTGSNSYSLRLSDERFELRSLLSYAMFLL